MQSRFSRQIVKDPQMNIIYIKTEASSQRHLRLLCYLHKEIEGTSANIFIALLPSLCLSAFLIIAASFSTID
jgi:hypothetical protein